MTNMTNTTAALFPPTQNAGSILRGSALVLAGTLFLALSSWVSVPTVPVPITMQTYAVIVVGALFGARMGAITVLAWLLEALAGMPVLAGGTAGAAVFLGPTAGYLFSFPVAAAFVGWLADRKLDRGVLSSFASMLAGNGINLALGVCWLSAALGWHRAMLIGLAPFWIGGVAKVFLATATVIVVRKNWRGAAAE